MKNISHILYILIAIFFINTNSYAEQPINTPTEKSKVSSIENPSSTIQNQININTATVEEISSKLHGIGKSKAQAIIEYRNKIGKFINIEQLLEVKGIGEATLNKNKDKIILK